MQRGRRRRPPSGEGSIIVARLGGVLALSALASGACGSFGPEDAAAVWRAESVNEVPVPGVVPVFQGTVTDTLGVYADRFELHDPDRGFGVPCVRTAVMDVLADAANPLATYDQCTFELGSGDPPVEITIRFPEAYHIEGNPLVGHVTVTGHISRELLVLEFRSSGAGRVNRVVYRRESGD